MGPVAVHREVLAEHAFLDDLECHPGTGETTGCREHRLEAWVLPEFRGHGRGSDQLEELVGDAAAVDHRALRDDRQVVDPVVALVA